MTPRLAALADCVPTGSATLADIGTDHGLLPIEVLRRGAVQRVIATDRRAAPLKVAERQIRRAGLLPSVELRQGEGLRALRAEDRVEVLSLAGLGGALVADILGGGPISGLRRLVLNPLRCEDRVRRWLRDNGFALIQEREVEDRGVFYSVLVAEPGDVDQAYRELDWPLDLAILVGPLQARRPTPALLDRWRRESQRLRSLVESPAVPEGRARELQSDFKLAGEALRAIERGLRTVTAASSGRGGSGDP